MDISKFDSQIEDLKKQINASKERLKKIREDFIGATKEFAAEWFQNEVKKTVISNPEQAKKLGEKGLKILKSDLQKSIEIIPKIVKEHIDKDEYWMPAIGLLDDKQIEFTKKYEIISKISDDVNKGIRELKGYAGEILDKHGLIKYEQYSEWVRREKRPLYGYGMKLPEKIDTILNQYIALFREFLELNEKLHNIKRQKARAEAEELWNKS